MKNHFKYGWIAAAIILVLAVACHDEFVLLPTVSLDDPVIELDQISLMARFNLKGKDSLDIARVGIAWGLNDKLDPSLAPSLSNSDFAFADEFFKVVFNELNLNTEYFFQAFVEVSGVGIIVSNIRSFSTKGFFLSTSFSATGERIDSKEIVQLTGTASGLRENVPVDSFGHIWITREEPIDENEQLFEKDAARTECSDCYTVRVPESSLTTYSFTDVVELSPIMYHYVRPYAIYNGEIEYGKAVEIFIGNFWDRIGFLPQRLTNATNFVIDDKAYILTGTTNRNFHLTNLYFRGMFVYDSSSDTIYADIMDPFPGEARIDAVAFTINGKGYVGSGRSVSSEMISTTLNDFWEYDPSAVEGDRWREVDSLILSVYDAISVVVNNTAYVGTGNGGTSNMDDFLPNNTLYVYSDTGWAEAGIPFNQPIANSVSWTIGVTAFIGTGHKDSPATPHLKLIWQSSDLSSGFGLIESYAGVSRQSAVAFAIGNRMYVGTGSNDENGFLPSFRDFYVFDLDRAARGWVEVDNLGDVLRANATAFAIGDRGFICGGLIIDNQSNPSPSFDIWEYTPSPN